jgi:hypothetical protein
MTFSFVFFSYFLIEENKELPYIWAHTFGKLLSHKILSRVSDHRRGWDC